MSAVTVDPRTRAIEDFRRLRQRAALEEVMARFTGKSTALLSFNEVSDALGMMGEASQGLKEIPVADIVGSVGRYDDFTRTFLPRQNFDAQRWASVKVATQGRAGLPPIKVYKIGEYYFVEDGNHRVSIARQENREFISAQVTEVHTRVSFSPDDQPDDLIIKAEYASFLKRTGIDRLYPEADLMVSAPGQYQLLEDLIDIHRFCTETTEQCDLSNALAISRWYEEAYLPVIEAIREQGVLRYFPGRTDTDFYIWLMGNQAELRESLGWELRPQALAHLAAQYHPHPEGTRARLVHHLQHLVAPDHGQAQTGLSRPSLGATVAGDRSLFPSIMVAVEPGAGSWTALDQALPLAQRDGSSLYGLCVGPQAALEEAERLAQRFRQRCQEAGVEGQFGHETGSLSEQISRRGLLADLVVLNCGLGAQPGQADAFTPEIAQVLQRCARPVLVVPGSATPCQKVLVAFDDQPQAREALYLGAYLATRWPVDLQVLSVLGRDQAAEAATATARQYLEEQEVTAAYHTCGGNAAETILQIAADEKSDLIVMGSYRGGWLQERLRGNVVNRVLEQASLPVLVCP